MEHKEHFLKVKKSKIFLFQYLKKYEIGTNRNRSEQEILLKNNAN